MKHKAGNIRNYHHAIAVVIAAASVLSCTKTIVSTDDARTQDSSVPRISFYPSASGMSKALFTPDNFTVEGTQIKVNDLYTTHEDIWSVAGEAKDEFIETYIDDGIAEYDPVIANDGSVSQWNFKNGETTSYKDYYWTPTGTHYFLAYTWNYYNGVDNNGVKTFICLEQCLNCNDPKDSDNEKADNEIFNDGLTYNPRLSTLTIKNWELTQDTQFDFCYAAHVRSMDEQNPYRPVELQMQHLFAAIQFNIINLIPDRSITLTSLSVSGLSNNGSVVIRRDGTLGNDMTTDEGTGKSYSSPTWPLKYNKSHNAFAYQGATGGSKIGKDGCILVWPHDSSKLQKAVATLDTDRLGTATTDVIDLFIKDRIEQWQAGRKYIYTIEIADNRISFSAKVVPWVIDDITLEE